MPGRGSHAQEPERAASRGGGVARARLGHGLLGRPLEVISAWPRSGPGWPPSPRLAEGWLGQSGLKVGVMLGQRGAGGRVPGGSAWAMRLQLSNLFRVGVLRAQLEVFKVTFERVAVWESNQRSHYIN